MNQVLTPYTHASTTTDKRPRAASLLVVLVLSAGFLQASPSPTPGSAPNSGLVADYGKLPLSFEENRGQVDQQVRYTARGDGFTLYLTDTGPRISLAGKPGAYLAMNVIGGDPDARVTGEDRLPGVANYLKGNDASEWQTNIPTFAGVRYDEILPRTDLVFYGSKQHLEFDFDLAAGADPDRIALDFAGADDLSVSRDGALDVATPAGKIRFDAPNAYQDFDGGRTPVEASWNLERGRAGFDVGPYDETRPLVIDPLASLAYSTFLGGTSGDLGFGVAVDGSGNAYITGSTFFGLSDLPTTPGAFNTTHNGFDDVFVAKFDATGSNLLYSTFLGGSGNDQGTGIAVDGSGNAYLTGVTGNDAVDFPFTPGAFDTTHNGNDDAFVAKLNASGSNLLYSTFLGGGGPDNGNRIDIDASGNAFVTGTTQDSSPDFPVQGGTFDVHNGGTDAFVTKLNPSGSAPLVYSALLGGSGNDRGTDVAVDASGNAWVTGETQDDTNDFPAPIFAFSPTHNGGGTDAFVAKLNGAGTALAYSTFLGGDATDAGFGIAVDGSDTAYVTGQTGDGTTDFPFTSGAVDTTHNGLDDAFVARVDSQGGLQYSTFLGGDLLDGGQHIAIDGLGNAYITGFTGQGTTHWPTTPGAFDTTPGAQDAFLTEIDPSGSNLIYSTRFGGSGVEVGVGIAVDTAGAAYIAGLTEDGIATDLFTTAGAFDTTHNGGFDAFVAKFAPRTISVGDVRKKEGRSGRTNFSFVLNLSAASQQTVTVQVATANGTALAGSDYVALSGGAYFLAGEKQTVVNVKVIGDRRRERAENFFLNLSNADGALIADNQGAATIKNDDP